MQWRPWSLILSFALTDGELSDPDGPMLAEYGANVADVGPVFNQNGICVPAAVITPRNPFRTRWTDCNGRFELSSAGTRQKWDSHGIRTPPYHTTRMAILSTSVLGWPFPDLLGFIFIGRISSSWDLIRTSGIAIMRGGAIPMFPNKNIGKPKISWQLYYTEWANKRYWRAVFILNIF